MSSSNFEIFMKSSSGHRAAALLRASNIRPAQLYDAVHAAVVEHLPYLDDCRRYTTEELCGSELWSQWHIAAVRVAGMCLAHLVKVGSVPLALHYTRSGKGKKRYYLRPERQGPEKQSAHIARAQVHGDNHQST